MYTDAKTVEEYLASLPEDRRVAMTRLHQVISDNIDPKFEEQMSNVGIGWVVPYSIYPEGYHTGPKQPVPYIGLVSQKNYIAFYNMCVYGYPKITAWFKEEYEKTGWRLDMGKSCIRFKKMDQIPYELIGQLVSKTSLEDYLGVYLQAIKH